MEDFQLTRMKPQLTLSVQLFRKKKKTQTIQSHEYKPFHTLTLQVHMHSQTKSNFYRLNHFLHSSCSPQSNYPPPQSTYLSPPQSTSSKSASSLRSTSPPQSLLLLPRPPNSSPGHPSPPQSSPRAASRRSSCVLIISSWSLL